MAYTIRFVDDHDTNNHQSFFTFLMEAKADPRCAIALKEVSIDEGRQEINFSLTDVKWYESYADVDSHTALFDQAQSWVDQMLQQQLHCKIGAIFMRIGESTDDVVEIAVGDYNWEWVRISRQIITDWS